MNIVFIVTIWPVFLYKSTNLGKIIGAVCKKKKQKYKKTYISYKDTFFYVLFIQKYRLSLGIWKPGYFAQ